MKQYSQILVYLFTAFLTVSVLTGCEDIVQFKGTELERKLVLNAVVDCSGNYYRFSISKTAFIYSNENTEEVYDADIQVSLNDKLIGSGSWLPGSSHIPEGIAFPPLSTGDKVSVRIEHDELGLVTAEDRVPEPPQVISVENIPYYDKNYGGTLIRTLIKIKDDPKRRNYYRLLITNKVIYNDGQTWTRDVPFDISQDAAMSSLTNEDIQDEEQNRSRIFPDDLFDGGEYTINITHEGYKDTSEYTIELQALTKSFYLYMRTLEQNDNSDMLHEPVKLYSNVKGGYGILGLYNTTKRTSLVKLPEPPSYPEGGGEYWNN